MHDFAGLLRRARWMKELEEKIRSAEVDNRDGDHGSEREKR
jgi:hypothetical protein